MPRPSHNTDQRLLRAARELLPQTGFSQLTLREVAAKAGVNLGMFHYHFENKHAFLQRVLAQMYDEFLASLNLQATSGRTSLERFRNALKMLGRFARDNRRLLAALARDMMAGNRDTAEFVEKNFPRHIRIVVALLRQCRRDGSIDPAIPMPVALSFAAAGVVGPNLLLSILERSAGRGALSVLRTAMTPYIAGDRAIDRRVDLALRALAGKSVAPFRPRRLKEAL
jgi:AcrR family transcriptional regulator